MLLTDAKQEAKRIGLRIAMRRQALSLSQEKLAEYSGLSENTIYSIESGRFEAKASSIRKIASALQCSTDSILLDEEPEEDNHVDPLLRALTYQASKVLDQKQLAFFLSQTQALFKNIVAYM